MRRVRAWFHDDVFRRLFLNAGRLLSAKSVAALIGLVVTALTARTLGPSGYGVFALVMAYEITIGRLVTFSAWQVIIKYGSDAMHAGDGVALRQIIKLGFLLDGGSAIAGTVIAIALSGPVIALLGWEPAVRELLVLYSVLILFTLTGTPVGVLRLFDRFDVLSYTTIVTAVLRLGAVVWAVLTEQELYGFVLVWLLTGIAGRLLDVGASLIVLHGRGLGDFMRAPLRGIRQRFPGAFDYVWSTNMHTTVRMVSREADELLIAGLTTPAAVGVYRIAKQFSIVVPMLIDPLHQSIYPELSRYWAAGNVRAFVSMVKRSMALVSVVALASWVAFVAIGRPVIVLIMGPEYAGAYVVAIVYMLAMMIATVTFPLQPALLAMGMPRESLRIQVFATAAYLAVLVPLVGWWFGILGAALSYLVYYFVWTTLTLLRLRLKLRP